MVPPVSVAPPGGVVVAHYLIEVGYTAQSWNAQIDKQANVVERITPALNASGAKLQCLYYSFGEVDLVGVIDFPTPEDAAAFALAVGSSGALRLYRTTPLLSIDQGIDSLRRASEVRKAYSPPLTVSLIPEPAAGR
jgi:uncharacterized protein with GYD domain